jgi:phospholipid/cholesterol/gamma-HCH transport system substrate-binding protein
MEREANYTAVGAFVLLVAALAAAFVYWYSDARNARSYERHEIYFEGSVSGLTVGSTVRYLGVDVGRVAAIRIDRRSASRVQVIVDLDDSTPIAEKTVAELSLLGVTGLLYIDLLGDAGDLQGQGLALGAELGQYLLDAGAVLADQGALGAALVGIAKHIQSRAAQALQAGQHLKAPAHGRAIAAL